MIGWSFPNLLRCGSGTAEAQFHAPHTRVLQLRIHPWYGDAESWTVYRHKAGARKGGKLVSKLWDRDADLRRVRSLRGKAIPKEWRHSVSVTERQFPLPGQWVAGLERASESISVPPIAGPVRELTRVTHYKLTFWRGRQESEFSWYPRPPKAWRPLTTLFASLLRNFRQHAKGNFTPRT